MEWVRLVDRSKRPIYIGIADAVEKAIGHGALRSGDRLPPHRTLAREMDIDLTTVTRAYAEARRRGLIDATVGRGTFVRAPDNRGFRTEEGSLVDMSMNLPPQPQSPSLSTTLIEGLASLIHGSNASVLMAYRQGAGSLRDREAAAYWLEPVLGRIDPDRVLVCAGAQCSITAIVTLLLKTGGTILTDPLTYPAFRAVAAHFNIRLVAVQSDQSGMLPDSVEEACRREKPQAIYCVPTIQNPSTNTMPVERREALAAVAARCAVPIIEDDAYGMLPAEPLPAVATFAPGLVYYIGTLSKCLSPGFRVAYVVAPGPALAQRLAGAVRATSLSVSPLLTSLITRWISDGTAVTLCDGIRRENVARQRIAAEILPAGSVQSHPEGLHLWLTLPEHWNRLEFVAYIRQQGLAIVPSDVFFVGSENVLPPNGVRICLGTASSQTVLRAALHSISESIRTDEPYRLTEVV